MTRIRFSTVLFAAIAAVVGHAQTYVAKEVSTGGFANTISGSIVGGSLAGRATLWTDTTTIDMHPSGFTFSGINGRSGNLSVGVAGTSSLSSSPMIWQGTAASPLAVPFAYLIGKATATDGFQIVGSATEGNPERGLGATHALLWDVATGAPTDLGKNVTVNGVGGGVQVGYKLGSNGTTACLLGGSEKSLVDLHVNPYDVSVASDTNGSIQVGYLGINVRVRSEGRPRDIRFYYAGFWSGTAASFTFLPTAYRHTFALGIKGDTIVGYGNTSDVIGNPIASHAVAWTGSQHDFVDLHAMLPADMVTSRAMGVDELGNIVGWGVTTTGVVRSYVWLRS